MERKFEVGDRVSFNWGGRKGTGKIVETETGSLDSDILVQLEGELRGEGHDGNGNSKKKYTTDDYWFFRSHKLTLIPGESIHITREGNTVHAVLKNGKNVVKRSKAVCNPDNEFDFETGAKLAMSRLFKESKEDSFPYKVGDKIKLKDSFDGLRNCNDTMKYYEGQIVTIRSVRTTEITDSDFIVRIEEDDGKWEWNDFFIEGLAKDCLPEYVEIVGNDPRTIHSFQLGDVCKIFECYQDCYVLDHVETGLIQVVRKNNVKPLKAVKRCAEVGEYIMLTRSPYSFNHRGDVLKVDYIVENCVQVKEKHHPRPNNAYDQDYMWYYTADHYVVLEGYISPEILVPHLETRNGHFYGLLGTPTKMKDLRGEPLFVGDIVELYDSSWRNRGDSIIVDDHGDKFVQGMRMQCKNSGDIDHDFIVIKKQSYKDLAKGKVYRSVYRVDSEEK